MLYAVNQQLQLKPRKAQNKIIASQVHTHNIRNFLEYIQKWSCFFVSNICASASDWPELMIQ